jgi:hypothetical protein
MSRSVAQQVNAQNASMQIWKWPGLRGESHSTDVKEKYKDLNTCMFQSIEHTEHVESDAGWSYRLQRQHKGVLATVTT